MFKVKKPIFGSNYYPEAWDRSEVDKDLDLMVELGLNCVRIAEFAWATMEPEDGVFDFSLFREVVDKCFIRGISVIMGTPTACPPRWLAKKHPEIFAVGMDGTRQTIGGRRDICQNSEVYLKYCDRIVEAMAKEFGRDENVIGWQIDNEIEPERGNLGAMGCLCDDCVKKFRAYMEKQYDGDIDALNREWGTNIFSMKYGSFEDFDRPAPHVWAHPSYNKWWMKFQNDTQLDFIKRQHDIIAKYSSAPIGHDSMPIFNLDYDRLSRDMDIMQFNHYNDVRNFRDAAFWYDLMRPAKNRPFWVTETSCCWNGSTEANGMRPKGFNNANVWLSVFMGAELVNYWLWRSHYGGHELMHGACVASCGRPFHVGAEIRELSDELAATSDIITGTKPVTSGIALHCSNSALETFRFQRMAQGFDYHRDLKQYFYDPLADIQLRPDVITPSRSVDEYQVVFTPFMPDLTENGLITRMLEWTKNGGTWVVGPMSDNRNRSGSKFTDRALGSLEEIAGVRQEFYLPKGETYPIKFNCGSDGNSLSVFYEAYSVTDKAETIAKFSDGEYIKGYSAITSTRYGKGKIVILGFVPDPATLREFTKFLAAENGVKPVAAADKNIVAVIREGEGKRAFAALEIAHEGGSVTLPLSGVNAFDGKAYSAGETVVLPPYGKLLVVENRGNK